MVLNTDWAQVEVINLINDGSGLAFGIIGGRSTGVVVKTIVPGGVADRDGRLQSGDHILQIGEVNLRGLGSEQVASVLRQCGVHVRMVVARPVESTSTDYQAFGSHAPIVPTKILSDPLELDKHLLDNGYGDFFLQNPSNSYATSNIYTNQQKDVHLNTISGLIDVVRNPLPIGVVPTLPPESLPPVTTVNLLPLDMALRETSSLPETEIFALTLKKDELGLGITVAGYVCEREEISGIFVKSISKGSAAYLTGEIKINDRIIEVNGKSVLGQSNHQAVEILRNAGNYVKITVERYLRGPKYEQLQQAILANEYRPASPPSPSVSTLPKIPLSLVHLSSLGIEPEGESRTSFDFDSAVLHDLEDPNESEVIIDTAEGRKSVQFSICSHESIYEKWGEKFGQDVEIVIAEMTKEANIGLGISLEGTVDVEDGKEVRPHHYIRNILPNGPVGINSILRSGDELLEVNGIQLLGLNHLEVVSILKQLPSLVILVCARYSIPTRIIDTAQHRDAFEARNILAESVSNLMKSSDKLVKAKSDTSITSSIVSETCCSAGSRSRSLEIVAGLPMWNNEITTVELIKGDHGLGFSILDYQDPLNPHKTVIVIRSLIPGGIAQQDGKLIPGDRLIAVNDIDLENATLDRAVQVLKGTPKGLVKIAVAKPLSVHDANSHHSQDTEDDQTCIDDFQECLEEYQECLEVVQICIEEERTFNQSPCLSQDENFCHLKNNNNETVLMLNEVNNKFIDDSEAELSFTSICDINSTKLDNIIENRLSSKKLFKTDSTQSDKNNLKSTDDSEKDGYETCLDESFSEDITNKMPASELNIDHKNNFLSIKKSYVKTDEIELSKIETENEIIFYPNDVKTELKSSENFIYFLDHLESIEETEFCDYIESESELPINAEVTTPTPHDINSYYSKENTIASFTKTDFSETSNKTFANSEPCLNSEVFTKRNQFCANISIDDDLNSYDNTKNINAFKEDEFFLVQYPDDLTEKCHSEPNVLEKLNGQSRTYRYKIEEYYNDIEDCLQSFREEQSKLALEKVVDAPELSDDDIFDEILIPSRSKSAPEILDNSFVTLTYDPGPTNMLRRKSSFLPGDYIERESTQMTVSKPIENTANITASIDVDKMMQKHWAPPKTVVINREPNKSLGISIVGGKVDLYDESKSETVLGIFIKNVVPNSPAGRSGELKTGDRILEVAGISLRNMGHDKAVETIKYAKNPISFLIQSLIPHSSSQQSISGLGQLNCNSPFPSPVNATSPRGFGDVEVSKKSPFGQQKSVDFAENVTVKSVEPRNQKTVESSEESDDEEDVRDFEGRTVSAKGQEIDRGSAANIKRSKEEVAMDPEEEDDFGYTMNKVKKKYANLGNSILMVQLERGVGQGLGLSLAGHKDRNCMAVFVCGINPKGAAFKSGGMQVGDEILEVNGVVLHGRCHLNASAIIKGLSGPIFKVIILRRKAAIDDIAVRPITQFPVSLAEEASEESFSNYPNVRTVAIKKGNQSLGIMIIEGKHAEVGQGIFISDIQEGSSAEKAGLEIGEMILAVNKDSLLGSNYDSAANLLKRTEGLVTLVVSNPGKKTSTPLTENAKGLKAGSAASRPTTPTPEPPADPTVCPITPGKDTTIEIASDNKPLGVWFIGGKDTSVPGGIIIVEVYPGGAADKDGRLQPGDQILDVNGTTMKDVSYNTALQALRQTLPKIKLVIYRSENPEFQKIDADVVKKPGKGLGLSITARKSGKGVYVTEILNGGSADIDGKIIRGDLLISVNGQSIDSCTSEEAAAALKLVTGKVSLKLNRFKPTTR